MSNRTKPYFQRNRDRQKERSLFSPRRRSNQSGFQTMAPYSRLSDKGGLRKKASSEGALLEILDILAAYLEGLTRIGPEDPSHDLHLKTRMDMNRTSHSPLLPDSCGDAFLPVWDKLFFIYRTLRDMLEDLLRLQDLFQIETDVFRYRSILETERDAAEALARSFRQRFSLCRPDAALTDLCEEAFTWFSSLLIKLNAEQSVCRHQPASGEILNLLRNIAKSNDRLCRRVRAVDETLPALLKKKSLIQFKKQGGINK